MDEPAKTGWRSGLSGFETPPLLGHHGHPMRLFAPASGRNSPEAALECPPEAVGWAGAGFYLVDEPTVVDGCEPPPGGYPAFHLHLRNPYRASLVDKIRGCVDGQWRDRLLALGHDGIILDVSAPSDRSPVPPREVIAFSRSSIRGAPGLTPSLRFRDEWVGRTSTMYHGSNEDIRCFSTRPGDGIYFSSDADYAAGYAEARALTAGAAVVYPAHLRIERPLLLDGDNEQQWALYTQRGLDTRELVANGYDAVVMMYADGEVEAMVFEPSQITLALSNQTPDVRPGLGGSPYPTKACATPLGRLGLRGPIG